MVKELVGLNFKQEVIDADTTTVVDFWAPWCGPCRMLGPVIDELSQEIGDKANFFKINVDENNDIAQKYRISSIPCVIVFKGGQIVDTMVGFRPKQDMQNIISKHL
ncbi:thioredoxin [Clostridium aestuarii]|uniref:Thioredoxin n=1 Tax=Clostridium aestuarii TaxID=338193 RepID=A0ABT4CWT1_9CLOT|nr:thioredoxin [Clostridium aestuarii]MCY6483449.1 thioredoxin [Clostridium aestuarii]